MICKLCLEREGDKKNTHYLTDKLIRNCLNEDGVNIREKGFMFDVSNKSPFIDFKFQRATSQKALLNAFGRQPTDEENQKAKERDFAVDDVFCTHCEKIFTEIEEAFINEILPQFRGKDYTGQTELEIKDNLLIRKFFLLQVWRTSVCDPGFTIAEELQERLRKIILNKEVAKEQLTAIPLNVTHLNTLGDDYEYTKNLVGFGIIEENRVIFLNDFVIQVFDKPESIKYVELFGLNEEKTFADFTNMGEESFRFKIINNEARTAISLKYYQQEKVQQHLDFYSHLFRSQYIATFGSFPAGWLVQEFINGILKGKDTTEELRYSISRFIEYGNRFFEYLIRGGQIYRPY